MRQQFIYSNNSVQSLSSGSTVQALLNLQIILDNISQCYFYCIILLGVVIGKGSFFIVSAGTSVDI